MSCAPRRGGIGRACAAALMVAAMAAAPAAAEPLWSVPALIPAEPNTAAPYGNQTATTVTVTPGGNAVVGAAQTLSPLLADGGLGPAVTRPASRVVLTQLGGYGRERLLAVGATLDANGAIARTSRSVLAFGTTDGKLDTPRQFDARQGWSSVPVALAVNPAGGAAVVVLQRDYTRSGNVALVLFVRHPGGSLHRAVELVRGSRIGPATVAINAAGDILAAWRHEDGLYARMVTADGHARTAQRVGASGYAGYISAALDATRRSIVAWVSQNVSEGDLRTPITVSLAHAAPGRSFAAPQVLESVPRTATRSYIPGPGVEVALLRDRGIVAWTGVEQRRFVVRVADITAGSAGAHQTIGRHPAGSATDPVFTDLATGPRGGVVVAWGADAPFTAVRSATGGTFAAPERIAEPNPSGFPALPLVAVDPVSGRVIAVWGGLAIPMPPGSAPVRNESRYAVRAPLAPPAAVSSPTAPTAAAELQTTRAPDSPHPNHDAPAPVRRGGDHVMGSVERCRRRSPRHPPGAPPSISASFWARGRRLMRASSRNAALRSGISQAASRRTGRRLRV